MDGTDGTGDARFLEKKQVAQEITGGPDFRLNNRAKYP
jgi:hypothetical protein